MKTKLLFTLLIVFSLSTFAQVPRTVLMEYATNASCGPCATSNPASQAFLESNYGRMVSIWYHAWWPGSGDPMYVANKPENENRIGYYGIPWVPYSVIDGLLYDAAGDANTLRTQANSRFAITSPVKIEVNAEIVNDSLDVTITMVVYGDVTQENLKLQTVIIEQMMTYASPPGSNGEVEFPHVFRKFIGGVDGIDVSGLSIGDSLTYTLKDEINPEWKRDVLSVVAFLQSQSSREVVQAGTDKKYHSISGTLPRMELINKNEKVNYPFSITNTQPDPLSLLIKLDIIENNQNWVAMLLHENNLVDSIFVNLATGESIDFQLDLQVGDVSDYIKLSVISRNESGFSPSISYIAFTKGDVLLVDDDGGNVFDEVFTRSLINSNNEYTMIKNELFTEFTSEVDVLNEFDALIWNLGDHSPSIVGAELSWLIKYLNDGGNMLFSGSDFAHDIHDVNVSSSGKFIFRTFLDVTYETDSVASTTLSSVPGNILFDNLNIELESMYSTFPDGVKSRNGNSQIVMQFDDTDYAGIVLNERPTSKLAYISFGLERIKSQATQDLVVEKIMNWLLTPVVGVDENPLTQAIPESYGLDQNFPNPFNPSTLINYNLPESGSVKIVIHDILGNEVANLVNEKKNAGYHSIEFNASHLTSGIYFYSINTGDFYQVKKMLLIK